MTEDKDVLGAIEDAAKGDLPLKELDKKLESVGDEAIEEISGGWFGGKGK